MSTESNNQNRFKLKRLNLKNFTALGLLAILSVNIFIGIFSVIDAGRAAAADDSTYTIVYDPSVTGQLQGAENDNGGIGKTDANGVLSQTVLYTRGGRFGKPAPALKLNTDASDENDMPIYNLTYYCLPDNSGGSISMSPPASDKTYLKLTMAVGLGNSHDWASVIKGPTVPTFVGMAVDDSGDVGSYNVPQNNSNANAAPAQTIGVSAINMSHSNKIATDMTVATLNPSVFSKTMSKCKPSPIGDRGNITSVFNTLSDGDKAKWKDDIGQDPVKAAAAASANASGSSNTPQLTCHAGLNPLNWLICGIVQGLVSIIGEVDKLINSQLSVGTDGTSDDPTQIFCPPNVSPTDTTASCVAYHTAWKSFRNIALGLLLIAGLAVLISQAIGTELFDAYTIRKVLPRLLVAALGITLSWQLMQLFVRFTNDLGLGVRHLIYFPFQNFTNSVNLGGANDWAVTLVGATALTALGIFGLLSFVATAALAVFVGFLILVVRQLVIILLIIIAPLAIVMYILPRTQRSYKLWWESFSKALLMYPLITGLIAVGRVFAAVASQQTATAGGGGNPVNAFIAFAAYFAPYFALPLTFKFAGAAVGQIGGFVNDRSRGGFDRLRNYRANKTKQNWQDLKDGNRLKGEDIPLYGNAARRFNNATRETANLKNAGYNPYRMRERMRSATTEHTLGEVDKALSGENHAFKNILGDDDVQQAALEEARVGGGEATVRRILQNTDGYSAAMVEEGVAAYRSAKRSMSTHSFHAALAVSSFGTSSGWTPKYLTNADGDYIDTAGNVVDETQRVLANGQEGAGRARAELDHASGDNRRLMVGLLGRARQQAESKGRMDLVGGSFTKDVAFMEQFHANKLGNEKQAIDVLTEETHKGALDGQNRARILAGHPRNLDALAPEIAGAARNAFRGVDGAGGTIPAAEIADEAISQLAFMANSLEAAGQGGPEMARKFKKEVLDKSIRVSDMSTEIVKILEQESPTVIYDFKDKIGADGNVVTKPIYGPDGKQAFDRDGQLMFENVKVKVQKQAIEFGSMMEGLRGNEAFGRYRREWNQRAQAEAAQIASAQQAGAGGGAGAPPPAGPTGPAGAGGGVI